MVSRLRFRSVEDENTGSLSSQDLEMGQLPVPAGDPLNILFNMLATNDQNVRTRTFSTINETETTPPVSVLSVRRGSGPDTFRLDVEISWAVAKWLSKVGSAFWPVFGAVEEQRKRERKQAERRAHFDERMARFYRAGRVGFHRIRKAISPIHKEQILVEIEERYGLERPAVEQAIKRHKTEFRKIIAKRRRAAIFRLKAAGMKKPEIAARCKVSITLVNTILKGPK